MWLYYAHRVVNHRFIGTNRQFDKNDAQTIRHQGKYMINIKSINTDVDYEEALIEIEILMTVLPSTPDSDKLDALVNLVETHSKTYYPH